MIEKLYAGVMVGALALTATVSQAGPVADRIEAGKPIRLGFANAAPWAFPGSGDEPLGFVNVIALAVLDKMGHNDIEPVVVDYAGLIPSMMAGRVDIITGGLYILGERCKNINFSNPIGQFGDAFIVPEGNPKSLENYIDIKDSGATMAVASGYVMIEAAQREGVSADKITEVPGITEVLAAVRAGRVDVGAMTAVEANKMAMETDGIDVTDTNALPEWTFNWVGVGFHPDDDEFRTSFNEAMKDYLGSPEMLETVEKYDYFESNIPGDVTTEWMCANR